MSDRSCTVERLKLLTAKFVEERDWQQFHTPKDLAMALASEAGELLALFRFQGDAAITAKLARPEFLMEVGFELADVLFFLMRLFDTLDLDVDHCLVDKMAVNAERYPVAKCRGRADKYTAYQEEAPK